MSELDATEALLDFITGHRVETLNVAGPRASKWPEAHACAQALLTALLEKLEPRRGPARSSDGSQQKSAIALLFLFLWCDLD